MKKLLLITTLLFASVFSFAQTKIPDNANIYILVPKGTGEFTKACLEKSHNWHVISDRAKADYVIKFNLRHRGTHFYANADIYKGADIIGSTSSVDGAFSSKEKIIEKLIKKRIASMDRNDD